MADISVIDFGFETQFGKMSANRCFAVLLENLTSAVPTRRASITITVDATARAATSKAKAVAERCQNGSIRTLSADLESLACLCRRCPFQRSASSDRRSIPLAEYFTSSCPEFIYY
jgi:hypothetical protein